jgi:DNA-binding response OmpR family regulator
MAVVLCTGVDQALMQTRRLILESAGHTVIDARDEREVLAACNERGFDVAVLGQAVSSRVKRHIAAVIRQHCPSAKVLEMYGLHEGRAVPDADDWLEGLPQSPGELPVRVERLLVQEQSSKAKASGQK